MALSEDLINFDLIEEHKENIVSLPSGRSARQLASILSPRPSAAGKEVTLEETKTLNDAIRQEYEMELQSIADADDPLDIYCRYVKWTLNAYPSAQSTPQSQLLPLLERATKAFLTSSDYKNDPRYLKLWLHYIRFFSDTPRETFAFLARHSIAEHLALFYEEFASWLESSGRWNQADEVYRLGVEREARPTERLIRKYGQFQQRLEARPATDNEPSSPALPRVRAALAAKVDPFAPAPAEETQQQSQSMAPPAAKQKKQKMAIFSDADAQPTPPSATSTKGWDSIGSVKERKKENTIEAQPWTGQTLKAGKRAGTATKMEIFKDPNENKSKNVKQQELVFNPRTGRSERVFVDMDAVYAEGGIEYSFEELRALQRGLSGIDWRRVMTPVTKENANSKIVARGYNSREPEDLENLTSTFDQKLDITESTQSQSQENTNELSKEPKPPKQKKLKVREIKQETQTVKLRSDSSTKPKLRKKISAEPTMTFNSKAAHNDIYEMYNHAEKDEAKEDAQSGLDTEYEDDTFSIAGESTGTGRISTTNSEFGDETINSVRWFGVDDTSASPWSDFTTGKISKVLKKGRSAKHRRNDGEDHIENMGTNSDQTQNGFDTQAIADLANQDFGELDTVAIARIAGDVDEGFAVSEGEEEAVEDLVTPIEQGQPEATEDAENPRYVPIPPEDYEPTPLRPYRDRDLLTQNKVPFMTPIVEQTENSLAASTIYHNHFSTAKTPCRPGTQTSRFDSPSKLNVVDLLLESPQPSSAKRKNTEGDAEHSPKKLVASSPIDVNLKILFPVTEQVRPGSDVVETGKEEEDIFGVTAPGNKVVQAIKKPERPIHKGPIILDLQCNPCDESVVAQILKTVYPAPSSYAGFHDHSSECSNRFSHIRAYTRKLAKHTTKSSPRKALNESTKSMAPLLDFDGATRVYAVKRQLGEGAFAPVFLVEGTEKDGNESDTSVAAGRSLIEALKAENDPKTLTWEFHVLHLLKSRLGGSSRAMESIILAHECHLYRDECYLVLEYHSQGTLLDLVNLCREENIRAGKTAEGLEEPVVMWLSVELLRTIEDVHKVGVLHGDLKADNCLVRFNSEVELASPYNRHGDDGWKSRGLTLIDFGRGIDTRAFKPEARFIADWKAGETDCPEIREAKPWKWGIDLFGAAGVIHSMLFGKYIETVSLGGGGLGQKKEWKLRDNFKRYWEKEIWTEVFSVLINGSGKKEDEVRKDLQRIRRMMEEWLEGESERNGRDLRGGIRRCERLVGGGSQGTKTKR